MNDHTADIDCSTAIERMAAYVDRELTSAEMDEVRKHLEHCTCCGDAFRFEGSILKFVRKACDEEPVPETFAERVIARLRQEA